MLSGLAVPPDSLKPSSPSCKLSLYSIGGVCAVGKEEPLPQNPEIEFTTATVAHNGLNASFVDATVHCVAAEPEATFLRISINDRQREVAYETTLLGRLRSGYRAFQLRSLRGTRIELCCLFAHVRKGSEPNRWASANQMRSTSVKSARKVQQLEAELTKLRQSHDVLVRESQEFMRRSQELTRESSDTLHT
mmetsp:Transcript_20536/g.61062  ORF Transcript_20536/g.61062 Transcript_20536/m.61062 type:complete len:192 (-) Transcript_20536:479-1054(-)